jgi:uncharacterized Zn finger protein (UPF0148 family)
LLSCEECGVVLVVDECGAAMGEIICCEKPMAKGKIAASKAKKKALAQSTVKTSTKKAAKPKTAAKKKTVPAKKKISAPVKKSK